MCCTTKFIKTFKQYELSWREQASKQDTHSLKLLNSMNCHDANKLQSKTPTTEIVTNTKVSNPAINRVKRIQLLQPRLCRQDQPVPIELESLDQQQLGSRDSDKGISHPSRIQSGPTCTTSYPRLPTKDHADSAGRQGQITPAEASNPTSPQGSLRFLFQHVHGPQERWRSEICHQPQIPEQICEIRAFQDGGPAHSQSSSPEERLDGQDRPQRCFLYGAYSSSILQVPPLQCGVANVSVQMPSLRSLHYFQSVHQSAQASSGEAEVNRHSSSDIRRRYASNGTLQHIAHRASICNPVPS